MWLARSLRKARSLALEIGILIVGLLVINLAFIPPAFRETWTLDRNSAALFGEFVGGYVGTYFGLVSVVLLVATLRAQRRTASSEGFATRFNTLLALHRSNADTIAVGKRLGRVVFVKLFSEWRRILRVVHAEARRNNIRIVPLDAIQISYYFFYYGAGAHSGRLVEATLDDHQRKLARHVSRVLEMEAAFFRKHGKPGRYIPFQGHQSRLGHYYRHLYQLVGFVHKTDVPVDKYEYVRTVRAQFSTHEQALFLLNSLTPLGYVWWSDGHMLGYKLVKNLPRDFFDSLLELDAAKLFPTGYFEWQNTDRSLPAYLRADERGLTKA